MPIKEEPCGTPRPHRSLSGLLYFPKNPLPWQTCVFPKDYTYHLFRLEGDGSAAEILEEIFLPKDGNTYGMHPPKFEILEDGRIVVYDFYEVNVYDASGKVVSSLFTVYSSRLPPWPFKNPT